MNRLSLNYLNEAVATGVIISDKQQGILDLAARDGAGRMPEDNAAADDEPFEIFQGFAEIFVVLTLFNVGSMAGHVLTVLMLVCTAFLSLFIDRWSFMTAGLVYIGAVLGLYTDAFSDNAFFVNALIIGLLVASLGTCWWELRQAIMSALRDFPGKQALATYMPADRP